MHVAVRVAEDAAEPPREMLATVAALRFGRRSGPRRRSRNGAAHADHPEIRKFCKTEVQPLYLFISDGVGGI